MIVFGKACPREGGGRHAEPALPGPLDPRRSVIAILDEGAQNLAAQRVHTLAHTPLGLLEPLGRPVRTELTATDRSHTRNRLGNTDRQVRNINGRGGGRCDTDMGALLMSGCDDTASYRLWR